LTKLNLTFDVEKSLSPTDGRYRHKLNSLTPFLSELALTKYRIFVEVQYLKQLSKYGIIRKITAGEISLLSNFVKNINKNDYKKIREIELTTNHDMKAVEEFIKQKLRKTSIKDIAEMVHFGITSDDTNNLSYALMIKDSLLQVINPEIEKIEKLLLERSRLYKKIPMLARTHGQSAVPTTIGKEFLVFYKRLKEELEILKLTNLNGKFMGNIGNLNSHKLIFPKINWIKFSEEFVTSLRLAPDIVVTQIEPYDSLIRAFHSISRINNILEGFCKDFWIYISMNYFSQKVISKEVGSTALPHKVNPIYFEGAEGGFEIANALFEMYSRKLSYSRLQRDLSDSIVRRSIPTALSYSYLSYQSVIEAIIRIEPNIRIIKNDLNSHWEILSEAIQNFLRTKGHKKAYEKTKLFFRGKIFNKEDVEKFVNSLNINSADKKTLLSLTPETYIGYAEEIIDRFIE